MRAVDIRGGKGDANALFINPEVQKPQPGESEALVKIKAFGLNRMDLLQREGRYPVPPQTPSTLGVEFSGTIESLGPHIAEKGFKIGDEVFGLAYGGAYAEYIAVSTHMLIHKPKELSWEEAAGIPEAQCQPQTWITATQALYLVGEFFPGKSVLWHAGASSVSIAGIQLSKSGGASAVYVTASSREKIDFCVNELGASQGFNYKEQDFAKEIDKATGGKGVDIIIDFIGQDYFQQNLDAAAKDGRIVTLGALSGTKLPAGVDIGAFVRKRLRFEGSSLRSRDAEYQGRLRDKLAETAMPKFKDGSFKIYVERVFRWEQVIDAHKLLESNATKGKIICTIE
ncbi:hypothetical protein FGG08_006867 [Glutinoglossum americanum]|uniref:Enoyl reductase (ER) domain-containing protein n=1 Tax=Glutinoglossum americanum TaxID=1670608 RepID=A0A9P8HXF6_9PEZI|nr:hypothetical protein FGG08_006867 [Glutinoglossum americanum]